jgi:hypothetical protein
MATRPERGRSVVQVVDGVRTLEGAGFEVRRPFPSPALEHYDPFLLLDETGPSDLEPGEAKGAPDHPHRGFETVTYLRHGRMEHRDSAGNSGMLGPRDVQWMTAGAGVAVVTPVDDALRNTWVLIRRVVAALRAGEAIPDPLREALDLLRDSVELLCVELAAGKEPIKSRGRMQAVAQLASIELIGAGAFSTTVVLAQLRSATADMLQATGMSRDDALTALPALAAAQRAPEPPARM